MAGSSVMAPHSASAGGAPLLSWPLRPGEPCIVTSNPEYWAALTTWDIREHDLDRWLEARHGAKLEDFWSQSFIKHRGRDYCEAVLKYIIMFNHEEVGGHAIMFIDQMVMQWPHYFPYAMKYRCSVDELFEPDQIQHYGRVFLEKVVEWCKLTYESSQAYWDAVLDNPPMDEQYDAFVQHVRDGHKPQKLKDMHIVPLSRPNKWPCDYFAEARGKTSVPMAQLIKEKEAAKCQASEVPTDVQKHSSEAVTVKDSTGHSITTAMQDDRPSHSVNEPSVKRPNDMNLTTSEVKDRTSEGGFDNENSDLRRSITPSLLVSKKEVSAKESEHLGSSLHRRVKSESDSPDKKSAPSQMSLADWMTAPGKERRAFSTESQSELVANTAKNVPATRTQNHGRGGLHQAGQYKYRQGTTAPVFNHPYDPHTIVMNNAAYLYHEDHHFGRHYPSLPDHSTTYRQGTNIYKTSPRQGTTAYHADSSGADMFVPLRHPHSGRFTPSTPHSHRAGPPTAPRMGQHGPLSAQVRGNPFAGPPGPSPRISSAGQHGAFVAHPYPPSVPSIPFGSVPPTIMVPYVQMAQAGQWPHVPERLSQVGTAPLYPGMPRIPRPSFSRTGHPNQGFGRRNMSMVSPQPSIEQQIQAVRQASGSSAPYMGSWEGRVPSMASEHMQGLYGSNENRLVTYDPPSGMMPGQYANVAPSYPTGSLHHTPEGPRRMFSSGHHGRRNEHSSDSTAPFPSYYDENFDPSSLPEGEQCTIHHIGPDAEDVVTLWFANIDPTSTVEQLRAFIEKKMPVDDIKSPFSPAQGSDLTWTFVRFVSNSDTRIALEYFAGREFNGVPLKVQVPDKRTKDGRRNSRGGSFVHRYPQPQQPTFTVPVVGHQTSFSGGGTPLRFQNMGNMSGPRSSRAGSMSQAISAVHRNRAFSKQDARSSELPVGDVSEAIESGNPSTPAPSIPEASALQASASPKKASKPKKKKKKKRPTKSRDASVTPSDSNMSSLTEGLAPSSDIGNAHNLRKEATMLRPSYSAALSTNVGTLDTPVASTDAERALSEVKPSDVQPAADEKVTSINERQSDTRASSATVHDAVEEVIAETGGNDRQEESLTADLETGSPAPVEQEFQLEPQGTVNATLDASEVVEAQSAATSSVTEQKDQPEVDNQHEQVDQSAEKLQPAGKVARQKGAAQTESFSIFATKNKSGKTAQKKKAKQAKQAAATAAAAARKASKQSSGTAEIVKGDADSDNEQPRDISMAGDHNLVADDVGNAEALPTLPKTTTDDKERSLSQHLRSESSSMAGTPQTAREYPTSAPNTPGQKLSFSLPETTPVNVIPQAKDDDSAQPLVVDDVAPEAGPAKKPKKKKPKKKPGKKADASDQQSERIIGKEADENDSDESGKTSSNALSIDHTAEHQSPGATQDTKDGTESADVKKKESFRTLLPSSLFEPESTEIATTSLRKENNKSSMTYAQAAKNYQDAKATAGGGLGLSERDVNVQR